MQALKSVIELIPRLDSQIGDCLTQNSRSQAKSVLKLEEVDYSGIAELLRDQLVFISQPPLMSGRECFGVKILTVATQDLKRHNDFIIIKTAESTWQIVYARRDYLTRR
jgi:hypothetical protein